MEGTIDSGALDMLIAITGASEEVGTRLLQVHAGDLNAAVNSFFNEGDEPAPRPQRDDMERNDWMEEDEPAIGIPVQSAAPFGLPPLPPAPWSTNNLTSNRMGGRGPSSFGSSGLVRVAHPPDVRNIPIDWQDDDDGPSYHPVGLSNPRIEEIPSSVDAEQLPLNHHHAMVDDEVPSTATSAFRSSGETIGPQRFGGPTHPEGDLDPAFNPNAPRIAEVPVMASDEGVDIEEEMLRAAIEASKREAAEASRRGSAADISEEAMVGGNPAERFPQGRATTEDDDLARAVTLSLKTAEEEKALRERGGPSSEAVSEPVPEPVFMQEDEDFSEDVRQLDSMRRRGIARDRAGMARGASASTRDKDRKSSGSRSSATIIPIVNSPPEEAEEDEEQPLLRRRTSRRSIPSTAESGIMGGERQPRSQVPEGIIDLTDSPPLPSVSAFGSREDGEGQSNPHLNEDFPSEWGGLSSEEHDEAVMLEAALFGGLPDRRGLGLPYHARRGIPNEVMDALVGENSQFFDPFNRRAFPQPPSPTVVAQRLIREQQDDEYLASLAADREKELKANEEAEARRLKEQEAAEAAASQEKLRREEELRQQKEAEDLERQLALKKESLPLEPAADEQGALTLVVRLPDGSRRGRRFHRSNKLQSLFDFIDIGGGVKPGTYRLVRQYPRVAFTEGELDSSLEALGLTSKQEVLFLELI
ncbi:unnamed protein product [Calypogeia fissa]